MAARVFSLPSIVLLFCAFILLLLVAISLPTLPALDIVRCHLPSGLTLDFSGIPMIKEIRVKLLTPSTLLLAELFFLVTLSSLFTVGNLVRMFLGHVLPIELMRGYRAYCVYDAKTGHRTCVDQGAVYRPF
jgi:hypothetical protein